MIHQFIVSDLQKKYGKSQILAGVNLTIESGECVGILGRNGSGKTTLLSILAGVERADGGSCDFGGNEIGYVPQINPLLENLSVKDNLWLFCKDRANRDRVIETYELQGMLRKKVAILSGGMKRRLAIACAMSNQPKLLIMDEPTAALDREYKAMIHEEMKQYCEQGGMIVLVTHEKEEMDMCDRCYLLEDGVLRPESETSVDCV